MRALITGATGFVGNRLSRELLRRGFDVRVLVRDGGSPRARELARLGAQVHAGDVLKPETLQGAGHDVDVAYYLVHSMGRGSEGDFAERERRAAIAFAQMASDHGVEQVI